MSIHKLVWWGEVVKCTPVREISGVEIAGSGVEIAHPLMYMITNTY